MPGDIPKDVERYKKETEKNQPGKAQQYYWRVAWDRYHSYGAGKNNKKTPKSGFVSTGGETGPIKEASLPLDLIAENLDKIAAEHGYHDAIVQRAAELVVEMVKEAAKKKPIEKAKAKLCKDRFKPLNKHAASGTAVSASTPKTGKTATTKVPDLPQHVNGVQRNNQAQQQRATSYVNKDTTKPTFDYFPEKAVPKAPVQDTASTVMKGAGWTTTS